MVSLPGPSPGGGWHELAEHVAETLDVGPGTRVFEVECGSGEFLEPFYLNGYVVGGTDADPSMIELAIAAMPEGQFTVAAASHLDPVVPWDVVICRSLGGAPDIDHLRGLVSRMCAKATHGMAFLNVPEEQHQPLVRSLAEAGARAVQIEGLDVFARV
jgi:2-polyprenyl-3-methyl-5-hydroxy-6-metoxy-1,4-benzoquinol methylase